MRQKGTESDRDREEKMILVVKAMADTVAEPSFTLDWECLDKNRFRWGSPWLCRFWEKHFLSRGVGLGFHCGHIEASLCLILLPCFIRLRGCCFLVFFIIVLKRVDAVKPGGNPPFLATPVWEVGIPSVSRRTTPASADWAGATCTSWSFAFHLPWSGASPPQVCWAPISTADRSLSLSLFPPSRQLLLFV